MRADVPDSLFAGLSNPPIVPTTTRTFGDFFAGIGLVRVGMERVGWQSVFANDLDPQKFRMYEGHFGPSPHYLLEDVHRLIDEPQRVPDMALAHASFPCTDLSVAGARRGIRSGQSSAFWGFERLLDRLGDRRPPLVLLENVVGFLTSHDGQDFADAMRAMTELGYAIDPILLDAAHFVPQSRPRLFIVCYSDSLPTADSLRPAARLPSPLRPAALLDSISRVRNVNWSARELPAPPTKGQKQLPEVLDELPDDSPQWWSTERSEYLLSQMSDRHRFIADAMIEKPGWSFGTVFRRVRKGRSMAELRVDGLAGCLRTPKGGSGRQILFKAGYGRFQVRLLNPDECARLMGAGGYRITVPPNQALMGFGDAVCADAVEWLARNYLNELIDAPGVGAAAQA